MFETNETRRAHAAGREMQFQEMMQALAALESRYKGVRGELLKKVREEFSKLEPPASGLSLVREEKSSAKRCTACGRELKLNGTDGGLVCMNGHRA